MKSKLMSPESRKIVFEAARVPRLIWGIVSVATKPDIMSNSLLNDICKVVMILSRFSKQRWTNLSWCREALI